MKGVLSSSPGGIAWTAAFLVYFKAVYHIGLLFLAHSTKATKLKIKPKPVNIKGYMVQQAPITASAIPTHG